MFKQLPPGGKSDLPFGVGATDVRANVRMLVDINAFFILLITHALSGSTTHIFVSLQFSGVLCMCVLKSLCCEQRCNHSLVVLMSI